MGTFDAFRTRRPGPAIRTSYVIGPLVCPVAYEVWRAPLPAAVVSPKWVREYVITGRTKSKALPARAGEHDPRQSARGKSCPSVSTSPPTSDFILSWCLRRPPATDVVAMHGFGLNALLIWSRNMLERRSAGAARFFARIGRISTRVAPRSVSRQGNEGSKPAIVAAYARYRTDAERSPHLFSVCCRRVRKRDLNN